ncbi:MAG: hypothetical protein JNL08_12595 [Planctomycetes bacterium]|nr:hypothetical protein [Planctomycetota bacterium]
MEKRDAFFLLLVLGGGGYAAYTHWDVIAEKLSFADLSPARLKAIDLAKDSSDLGQGFTNWQYLQTRARRGEITLQGEPWSAEPIAGEVYRVLVRWHEVEADETMIASFRVDIANRTVAVDDALASPR